jgi:hypothetical protein
VAVQLPKNWVLKHAPNEDPENDKDK